MLWPPRAAGEDRGHIIPVFYRIVQTNPPSMDDFVSRLARGFSPRRDDPETLRLEGGISVYATVEQARRAVRRFPMLGRFIAELDVADAGPVTFERTLNTPGHHTLWGEPHDMLNAVKAVLEVG